MISEFRDAVEVGWDESQKHEQKYEDNNRVEEPFFLKLKILGVVNHLAYKKVRAHSLEHSVKSVNNGLMVVGIALCREAQSHVEASVDTGVVGSFIDKR